MRTTRWALAPALALALVASLLAATSAGAQTRAEGRDGDSPSTDNVAGAPVIAVETQGADNNYVLSLGDAGIPLCLQSNADFEALVSDGDSADDLPFDVALPFPFDFYGTTYDEITVNTNGAITFGGGASAEFSNQPMSTNPEVDLAVFWDDLEIENAGSIDPPFVPNINVCTFGIAPQRTFTIAWEGATRFPGVSSDPVAGDITFQAALFEADNSIEYRYSDTFFRDGDSANYGGSATVGIGDSATQWLEYSFDQEAIGVGSIRFFIPQCMGQDATIVGTRAGNTIEGTPGDDVIYGYLGDNSITALSGDDLICTVVGDDTIFGQAGDDTIISGAGNDAVFAGAGNDTIFGQAGDDELNGAGDDDIINGGGGNDFLIGGNGNDDLRGQAGNDTLQGGNGVDQFFGGGGNDTITTGDGANAGTGVTVQGGSGADTITGSDGNDILEGGAGPDTIIGGIGDDTIFGGRGADTINGNEGNDSLNGGPARDTLNGGNGNDDLTGGTGSDDLFGNAGNDSLNGQGDTDLCDGGIGADSATSTCENVVAVP